MNVKEMAQERLKYELENFGKTAFTDFEEVDNNADMLRGKIYFAKDLDLIDITQFCDFITEIHAKKYDAYEFISKYTQD